MRFHLTEASKNQKTGPIPVVTISKETCPDSCPLKNGGGCYAEHGPVALHWRKVTEKLRGVRFDEFLRRVRQLPHGVWRYGQAGDLPGVGDNIDREKLNQLSVANRHRPVIAFTHKPINKENREAIFEAEKNGFHINASADSLPEADDLLDQGVSVVSVISKDYARKSHKGDYTETLTEFRQRTKSLPKTTPKGTRLAICPATYLETTCQKCMICSSRRKKNVVVGFPAHGTKSSTIEQRLAEQVKVNDSKQPGFERTPSNDSQFGKRSSF